MFTSINLLMIIYFGICYILFVKGDRLDEQRAQELEDTGIELYEGHEIIPALKDVNQFNS